MSAHTKTVCSIALLWGLLVPGAAFAMPGNVTGIRAQVVPDGVRVSWEPAEGEVSTYRVFWSHESILENNALFDDVVETEGPETSITLSSLPAIPEVFVTVLAVDPRGEESELFEEEAHTLRTAVSVSSQKPSPTSVTSATSTAAEVGTTLRALKAEAISATGVLVTFTHPVLLEALTAQTAFSVVDGDGQELPLYRVKTDGLAVELHTLPQTQRRAYRIHIDDSVRGRDEEQDDVLSLALDQTDLLFIGSAEGVVASVQPTTSAPNTTGDIAGMQVRASADGMNTYTVELQWQPTQGAAGYRVAQTRDGGRTFGQAQTLPATVNAVRIPKTPAGELGMLVQAMSANGLLSRGVLQRVILPTMSGAPRASLTSTPVRSMPPRNASLPQTGLGSALLLASAGACAGIQVMRKRKSAA